MGSWSSTKGCPGQPIPAFSDSFPIMDGAPEKSFSKEKRPEEAVNPPVPYTGMKMAQSRKQRLSPYFTIAAAAFGLISDGCESKTSRLVIRKSFQQCSLDQNNLMTMANVTVTSI